MEDPVHTIKDLVEDLEEFAGHLETGASGWLIMPLVMAAWARMSTRQVQRASVVRGALWGIFYALDPDVSRGDLIAEVRRVVAAMKSSLEAEG